MTQTLNLLMLNLVGFLPQLLAGLSAMVIGVWLAKLIKKMVTKLVRLGLGSAAFSQTPIEQSLKAADLDQRIDEIVGSLVYWLVFLFTVYVAASVLGLSAVTNLLSSLFAYSPKLISALIVLILGTVLAGFVEKIVKNSLGRTDLGSARAASKISSYTVMVMTALIALSEIGIAREFILIAFIGLVTTLALGVGLAVGLGSKDMVSQMLLRWVKLDQKNQKSKK